MCPASRGGLLSQAFHRFSQDLHYLRTILFASDLKGRRHTLKLRTTDQKNRASSGTAVRILEFVAN
jgi:hypothetical protein